MRKLFTALALTCLSAGTQAPLAQGRRPELSRDQEKKTEQKRGEAQKDDARKPAAPDDEEVVSVDTTLVTVPVRVMDRSGRFIPDLKREDFRLSEDGEEQEISFFETADQPLTVALVLDISDSTTYEQPEIQAAARAFLEQLRPADRVMLVAFDKYVRVLTEPTGDREALYRAISSPQSVGGTSFYDALIEVIEGRFARERGRKAVVLFTDGIDTTSRATPHAAMRAAEESDALVYAIQYDTVTHPFARERSRTGGPLPTGPGTVRAPSATTARGELLATAYKRANGFMRLVADRTNGRYYMAQSLDGLKRSFAQIAGELREQYSLGYYPKNRMEDGKLRKLKVKVSRPETSVRARRAYVYKPRKGAWRRADLAGRATG